MKISECSIGQKVLIPFAKNGLYLKSKDEKCFSHFVSGDVVFICDQSTSPLSVVAFEKMPDINTIWIGEIKQPQREKYSIPDKYKYLYYVVPHEEIYPISLIKNNIAHLILGTALTSILLSISSKHTAKNILNAN